MRLLAILTIFLILPFNSFAASERAAVGDMIPHTLNLMDQNNAQRSFESLVGDKGATLVFFRSVSWCPYCQMQMTKLNREASKFINAGYPLVGISYDSVEDLQRFEKQLQQKTSADKSGVVFLSDENSGAIKDFGLLNTKHKEGSFAYGVPHPAIYIVDKNKIIKAVLSEDGYKDRPEASAILKALEE